MLIEMNCLVRQLRVAVEAFEVDSVALERKLLRSTVGRTDSANKLIMPTEASSSAEHLSVVIVRAAALLCALPLASVIETMRCPPLTAVSGTPQCVAGVAMIRGAMVAVVDLGILLGSTSAAIPEARLVTLRIGGRSVGLAVHSVIGVRELDSAALAEVPPMLRQANPGVLTAVASLDRELLLVLDGSRILTEELMGRLED